MGVLVWVLIKIPLLLVALIAGLYLLYLKNMYDVVDAECISCDKNDETKKYRLMYRYMTIHGNVIEQNEKPIDANSPRDIAQTHHVILGNITGFWLTKSSLHSLRRMINLSMVLGQLF